MPAEPEKPSKTCTACGNRNVDAARFCSWCGTRLVPQSTLDVVDAYAATKVDAAVATRLKDQGAVVRELADKAEDVVWRRFKVYVVFGAVLLGVLGFFGVKSFQDLESSVEAKIQLQVAALQGKIDHLSEAIDAQAKRVSDKGSEITEKLQSLDQSVATAQTKAGDLSAKLESDEHALENKVAQVTRQVDRLAASKAYPSLGEKMFVTFEGGPWDSSQKAASDKWINIYIDVQTTASLQPGQLNAVVAALREHGYTSFPGIFGVGGPYASGLGPLGNPAASSVFYFRSESAQIATEAAELVSSALPDLDVKPVFVDPAKSAAVTRFVIENSKLDLQLYLFKPLK